MQSQAMQDSIHAHAYEMTRCYECGRYRHRMCSYCGRSQDRSAPYGTADHHADKGYGLGLGCNGPSRWEMSDRTH